MDEVAGSSPAPPTTEPAPGNVSHFTSATLPPAVWFYCSLTVANQGTSPAGTERLCRQCRAAVFHNRRLTFWPTCLLRSGGESQSPLTPTPTAPPPATSRCWRS